MKTKIEIRPRENKTNIKFSMRDETSSRFEEETARFTKKFIIALFGAKKWMICVEESLVLW